MNRIDSNQLSQLQAQTKKTNNNQKLTTDGTQNHISSDTAQPAAADTVQISDTGRQLNEMEKSMGAQSFDQQRVSAVKQAIENKSYQTNVMSIAEKMVNFDN